MDSQLQAVRSELAPTGTLRAAINTGNIVLTRRGADGEWGGAWVALACEAARRLGVPCALVEFASAGGVLQALADRRWDLAFLAEDPDRAAELEFTEPYVHIETTYAVREEGGLAELADVDAAGIRIAVSRGSAYERHLSRALQRAELVGCATPTAAIDCFLRGDADALAAVRQPLDILVRQHPGLRILPGAFHRVGHTLAVPKGRRVARDWLDRMLAELRTSGFIATHLA